MFRNKEIAVFMMIVCAFAVVGTVVLGFFSIWAEAVGGIFFALLIAAFLGLTLWRYRQIDRLSNTLRRVNNGNYALEPDEDREGELSILKSEIYKTTLMLRQQTEQLQKEKNHLADSLSDISHQLKTPLTSMFVMTDLLCGEGLSEEKRTEFTENSRQQLQRMQWLVEALLKLSKLDANTVVFNCQNTIPENLAQRAIAPLIIPAELKNLTLSVKTDSQPFCCDLNWTAEALVNILKNCMEHTPSGGQVELELKTNPLYTKITVQDSGSGIDSTDLPHVFERFYKGKNAGQDGVGIGLAMAKTIVEAQGGSIDVKNKPDSGVVFTIRFPHNVNLPSLSD